MGAGVCVGGIIDRAIPSHALTHGGGQALDWVAGAVSLAALGLGVVARRSG